MARLWACLLVLSMLFVPVMGVALEEHEYIDSDTELRFEHTESVNAKLSIAGTTASCVGTVKGRAVDTKSSVTATLYRYDGGWIKVASWSASGNGRSTVSASGTKAVTRGYKYKVTASGTIKDASGKVLERPTATKTVEFF